MALLGMVAGIVFLGMMAGLRTQQKARLQIAAASRMLQLSHAWANSPHLFDGMQVEAAEMAELGNEFEHDLERELFLRVTSNGYRGWAGVSVVPPAIVSRIESDNDEIRRVLADGGQLYYFLPGPTGMSEVADVASQSYASRQGGDNRLGGEDRKLVFAVRGKPQQNALRSHPALDWPCHELYPGPVQPWHRRQWHWNLNRTCPATASADLPQQAVLRIDVSTGGSDYLVPPAVTIDPPSFGRQAQARAIVNRGEVTAIEVIDPGYGYTSVPSVLLTAAVTGGSGAAATAGVGTCRMAMLDYTPAGAAAGSATWSTGYPSIDWDLADQRFQQLYDYCYHFRRPGAAWMIDPTVALDGRTWVDAAHMKLLYPVASTATPPNDRPAMDDSRDPINRFACGGYWLSQIVVSPVARSNLTTTAPNLLNTAAMSSADRQFYTQVVLTTFNYDNASRERLDTGEQGRTKHLLLLSQQLLRALLREAAAGTEGTSMTYYEDDFGLNPEQRWPVPNPPKPLPSPLPTGWLSSDEHIFPPPFKLMAISYLAFAAQVATRVPAPGAYPDNAWDDGQGVRAITLSAGGSGYTSDPAVLVSGGGGSGCLARAVRDAGGSVAQIVVLDPGTGYTAPPTVTLLGGGGSGAAATATIGPNWDLSKMQDEVKKLQRYCQRLHEVCLQWAARYASADPYDWGAPRPLNRMTAWDFPLLQWDLLPTGEHRPPTPALLPYLSTSAQDVLPNSGDLDLLGLISNRSQYSLFDRSGANLTARLTNERERPAWRRGLPYSTGVPTQAAAEDIDRSWKVIAARAPQNWGPSRGLAWFDMESNFDGSKPNPIYRISQQWLPPGSPGEQTSRPAAGYRAPADFDNAANLWYSWGDHARFNLSAPFAASERFREVVFWAVDWQAYEDFETARDPEYDARAFSTTSTDRGGSKSAFTDAQSFDYDEYRAGQAATDRNNNGRRYQEIGGSGDARGVKPDRGPLSANQRLRAEPVARYLYYDGRLFGGIRQ